jgi:hypothetical protein
VCEGRLRGYSPIVRFRYSAGRVEFLRGGGDDPAKDRRVPRLALSLVGTIRGGAIPGLAITMTQPDVWSEIDGLVWWKRLLMASAVCMLIVVSWIAELFGGDNERKNDVGG